MYETRPVPELEPGEPITIDPDVLDEIEEEYPEASELLRNFHERYEEAIREGLVIDRDEL